MKIYEVTFQLHSGSEEIAEVPAHNARMAANVVLSYKSVRHVSAVIYTGRMDDETI